MRVYVETSVWSFVIAEDAPDLRARTLDFFDRVRSGELEAYASTVVLDELMAADEPTRSTLMENFAAHSPRMLKLDDCATRLADAFLLHGAVPPSKTNDALHVALAFVAGVDAVASWNFKHIASVKREARFNAIAVLQGIPHSVRIVNPMELLDDNA